MSEEEKKAIERLNIYKEKIKDELYPTIDFEEEKAIGIVLNLIEKQSKEIEELEENLKIATAMLTKGTYPEQNEGDNDFCKQFIPKSKIKEKIKELEKQAEEVKNHYKGTYACLDEYLNAKSKIQGFKELLEEGE